MKKASVRLVIDANVAKSAGAGAASAGEPAPQCVAALNAVSRGEVFQVAFNAKLKQEWLKHGRSFAIRWLQNMIATKRFRSIAEDARWDQEQSFLSGLDDQSNKSATEIYKDIHLLKLAMLTDGRVISLDKKQVEWLRATPSLLHHLRGLHWANPTHEFILEWIQRGAPEDARFGVEP